jgi:hypothetical protein
MAKPGATNCGLRRRWSRGGRQPGGGRPLCKRTPLMTDSDAGMATGLRASARSRGKEFPTVVAFVVHSQPPRSEPAMPKPAEDEEARPDAGVPVRRLSQAPQSSRPQSRPSASASTSGRRDRTATSRFLLTASDEFLLALAGLWRRWSRPGADPLVTFTVVTPGQRGRARAARPDARPT